MRVVVPLFEGFWGLDAVGPYEVLSKLPGATVTFAASRPGPVRTQDGQLGLVADMALDDVTDCDAIVVPGGAGTRPLVRSDALSPWLRRVSAVADWTTSVCTGSLLLAAAGLLGGRRATTYWRAAPVLESLGATFVHRRVVVDGNFITGAGVSSGIDMALTLVARMAGDDMARALELVIEYDPEPPFDSGSVEKAGPSVTELANSILGPEDRLPLR